VTIPFAESALRALVSNFLAEDMGRGDLTTSAVVPPTARARARVLAKQPLVVAGLDVVRAVFVELDPSAIIQRCSADGEQAPAGETLALINGSARALLSGERVALNLLQRLSGIATLTRRYVDAVKGTNARIVDTRKTTPGLRALEKYAVRVGGGQNHRMGLDDGVLIKDNHIAIAGGLREAVEAARAALPHLHKIQVEVENLDQLREAVKLGAIKRLRRPCGDRVVRGHHAGDRSRLCRSRSGPHLGWSADPLGPGCGHQLGARSMLRYFPLHDAALQDARERGRGAARGPALQ